ncbi:MAG: hypothetical protein ACRDQT_09620, partial [Gaiellaceae bacterium]
ASIRRGDSGGVFEPVDTGGDDTEVAYRQFLAAREANVLVSASRQGPHFGPAITQRLVESAARSLGFERVERLGVPDGRELRVWVLAA